MGFDVYGKVFSQLLHFKLLITMDSYLDEEMSEVNWQCVEMLDL